MKALARLRRKSAEPVCVRACVLPVKRALQEEQCVFVCERARGYRKTIAPDSGGTRRLH